MAVKEWTKGPSSGWTPEQAQTAATYGVCLTCGAPRTVWNIEDGAIGQPESKTRTMRLVCSAEPMKHPQ